MTVAKEDALPFAGFHVVDDGSPIGRRVLVLVDGKPIAEIPATRVTYEVEPGGLGVLTVSVVAMRAAMTGGAREAIGRI